MTREEMVRAWQEIQALQESASHPDQVHALGLLDDLAAALADKILILDGGKGLYEYGGSVFVADVVR